MNSLYPIFRILKTLFVLTLASATVDTWCASGHVDMVVRAKASLENEYGYTVLAGWISPSNDAYVRPKSQRTGSYFVRAIGR